MDDNKVQELLLKLIEDMAYVKAKLDNIDEQKLNNRIEKIEMITERQEKQISSLENRSNILEQFVRDNMVESKKEKNSIMLSIGIAVFSAVLSLLFRFI